MLKIEVIKFEAQDVITASTAECICSDDTWYHGAGYLDQSTGETTTEDHTRGSVKCPADSHPNCYKSEEIN